MKTEKTIKEQCGHKKQYVCKICFENRIRADEMQKTAEAIFEEIEKTWYSLFQKFIMEMRCKHENKFIDEFIISFKELKKKMTDKGG